MDISKNETKNKYEYARKWIVNYLEENGPTKRSILSKKLKQLFKFNDNQISGLLNKMSTRENSISRVDRGLYTSKKYSSTDNDFNNYLASMKSFENKTSEFISKNIFTLTDELIIQIKNTITDLKYLENNLKKINNKKI